MKNTLKTETNHANRGPRTRKTGLAAILLAALSAGCATGATGGENFLTVFVDNYEGQAVVVSLGPDTWCQVDARVTRHACRFGWAGTGSLELQISNPSRGSNHVAQAAEVSGGDRMCLQVRDTGVQMRRC